ncbi:hypothetical protein [Cytobacillus oceanisediminis]|uniref:hypothetical protein n=1 Tax=Cytobacillus oceanisediminis TaxID=665099 RepID=UPI002494D49A|nr:hypothetical protein [Cytobacillus oceanisediminis]
MEQYISVIIFSLPGVLTYFWLQLFGLNPTVKHTPTEMVGLSALLWAPTTFLTVVFYNFLYFLCDLSLRFLEIDLTRLSLGFLNSLESINAQSNNLVFLFYYLLLSVLFSGLVALVWSVYIHGKLMIIINKIRLKRKLVKLSEDTSVWDSFFLRLEKPEESPLIVEYFKIDKPEEKMYGAVTRMSRPFETERAIILDDSSGWKESHEYYQYPIKRSYFDTKSGIVINELDYQNPKVKE